jgi:hypothetical protein
MSGSPASPTIGPSREHGPVASTPRWVKVFGTISLILMLLFVLLHLPGGLGQHELHATPDQGVHQP